MGTSQKSNDYIDLTVANHTPNMVPGLKFTAIESLLPNGWSIQTGQKLQYKIHVKADKDVSGVGYRHGLFTANGEIITLMIAPRLIDCMANEELVVPLEADMSCLVPGQYYLTIVLYESNEFGGYHFMDHIEQAVTFDVHAEPGFNDNMLWNCHGWGNVKFPDIKDLRKAQQCIE